MPERTPTSLSDGSSASRTTPPDGRASLHERRDVRVLRNPVLRGLFIGLGWLCVASGAVGVVLPGWPTTIWIILATYFFARSSPRFHDWIMSHRVFGPLIRDWRDGKGMTARAKAVAVTTMGLTITLSITLIPVTWVRLLLAFILLTVSAYLLRLPTKPAEALA